MACAGSWRGCPAHQLDLQSFVEFVLECSLDNRMTTDAVRGRLTDAGGSSLFQRVLLRLGLVDRLKLQTLELRNRIGPMLGDAVPRWGHGRVDTFNPYKAIQFNWPLERLPRSELIGASDFPSLWNQQPREGLQLHWDGNNDSVDERNLSAGLGAGITPVTVDHAGIKRIRDWIWTPPPDLSVSNRSHAGRARRGGVPAACLECHGDHRFREGISAGGDLGRVVNAERDRHGSISPRLLYPRRLQRTSTHCFPSPSYRFRRFRKTTATPTIRWTASGRARRTCTTDRCRPFAICSSNQTTPPVFYRGYDVYDQNRRLHSKCPRGGRTRFFRHDIGRPGQQQRWAPARDDLPDQDKFAIIEYLKTF